MCRAASFSGEDISLLLCAEETGNYGETFRFLADMYAKRNEAKSKFFLCAVYPVCVVLLAAGTTVLLTAYADTLFPLAGELLKDGNFLLSMRRGVAAACIFLAGSFGGCIFAAFKIMRYSPLYVVFSLLEFLTGAGIDVYQAIGSAVSGAVKDEKLTAALIRVKDSMNSGISMEKAFAGENIFRREIFFLEAASVDGSAEKAFSLCARRIEKERLRNEQMFLRTAEPAMLLAAGVYIALLLRCTVMPLMTNYGGLI
jgi:type II secretory pathway component PulF